MEAIIASRVSTCSSSSSSCAAERSEEWIRSGLGASGNGIYF